jgi:hypothetical protein
MKKKLTTSNIPTVGMGATIHVGSDAYPATVIQVTRNGKRVVIQEDIATRIDNNGMSESQDYTYEPNPEGEIHIVILCKDGRYRESGTTTPVSIGFRRKYYDYSF